MTMAVGEQTSLFHRKVRAGQRLIIGISSPFVDDDTRALIAAIRPAGFILFQRNVVEPEQVRDLNRELASLVDPHYPALLTVDQEGGRVQRVRAPATVWPAMRVLGRQSAEIEETSRAIAIELRAMGFNLNFAPVADVDSNPDNPVIGDRSFGRRPEQVAEHVAAFIHGHQDEGVIACAKHFPGHGDTNLDSHLDLPTVEKDPRDLEHVELVPFQRAVAAGVGTIMTSHVIYPAWDEEWPATLSANIVHGILRQRLGYEGVVFSDDMEMKAVHGRYPTEIQVRRATLATVDILLCCKEPTLQYEAFEALVRMQEEDSGLERSCETSVKRVHALRERFFLEPRQPADPSVIGCARHRELSERLVERGV
jgi:beta-N-acetylhexosaminidase